MATLNEIDRLTEKYADLRNKLGAEVGALEHELEGAKRAHLQAIKRLVQRAAEAHGELKAAIEDSAEIFLRPKTQVLHGVKVGFRKGSGGIQFEDADQVVALIEKHFTKDECELLIITKKKPNKEALEQLDVKDLKRVACTIEDTGDVVVIKDTASEVDKIVKALLKEATEEVEA